MLAFKRSFEFVLGTGPGPGSPPRRPSISAWIHGRRPSASNCTRAKPGTLSRGGAVAWLVGPLRMRQAG